jgi:hypothetical protein
VTITVSDNGELAVRIARALSNLEALLSEDLLPLHIDE